VSEDLSAFHADLHHKARDEGWVRNELVATEEDVASVSGGELRIVRSEDTVTSGNDSSGRAPPPAAGEVSPVDTGSTASSRLVLAEVRRERERGDARVEAVLEAAAARMEMAIVALMTHAHMSRAAAEGVLRGAP
jgi:hypothetical protein